MKVILSLYPPLLVIWGCFIASLFLIKKKPWQSPWSLFSYYLFIVACIESISGLGIKFSLINSTTWLYNPFLPIHGFFYFYVFKKIIHLKTIDTIIYTLISAFILVLAWEAINFGYGHFFFRALTVLSLMQLFLCGLYFYSLFQQDEYFDLLKAPDFWFTTGTLFYFTVIVSTTVFFEELLRLQNNMQIPIRTLLVRLSNLIMYGCWIKSFLCINNKKGYITPY